MTFLISDSINCIPALVIPEHTLIVGTSSKNSNEFKNTSGIVL